MRNLEQSILILESFRKKYQNEEVRMNNCSRKRKRKSGHRRRGGEGKQWSSCAGKIRCDTCMIQQSNQIDRCNSCMNLDILASSNSGMGGLIMHRQAMNHDKIFTRTVCNYLGKGKYRAGRAYRGCGRYFKSSSLESADLGKGNLRKYKQITGQSKGK